MTDSPPPKSNNSLITAMQNLQNSPLISAMQNLQNSSVITAMQNLQNSSLANILKSSPTITAMQNIQNSSIASALLNSSVITAMQNLQATLNPLNNIYKHFADTLKTFDWDKFKKMYHLSMIKELNAVKDERITAILGQVLTEYWLNIFVKTLFSNHTEIQNMSFDTKRKILFGLGVINSNLNHDLKKLDDIRAEYAHNFDVDKDKVLGHLQKMNSYKALVKQHEFTRNSKNNSRIKKSSIKLVSELMDIEDKFIIEVKKITKSKSDKKN